MGMPKKLTIENFLERCWDYHNDKYDYSLVVFVNTKTKVKVVCPFHGIFEILPSDHMRGVGCANCYYDSLKLSTSSFIEKALSVHGLYYRYELVEYKSFDLEIKIICPIHGVFQQKPYHHLTGRGCRKCFVDDMIIDIDTFLNKTQELHNGKYTYDTNNYVSLHSIINIICPIHGKFTQLANNHFNGSGCPLCSHTNVSKIETLWLDSLGIPILMRNKVIFIDNKRFNVDAVNHDTNTIYEFYGDFWHGNPQKYNLSDIHPIRKISYGQLYQNTITREKILSSFGYNIVSIWESDFR